MASKYDDERVFDVGDIVGDLECTGVSFQETEENGRYNFTYLFKLKSECDAARKAERDHQAELKRQAKLLAEQEAAEKAEELAHRNEE